MLCPNYVDEIPWLVLLMRYATIVPWHVIDRVRTTNLNANFSMNANKMWCKSRFFFLKQMLSDRDAIAIFMMQMSHTGVQMQSLSMMVPVHIFKPWCQYLLVGMPWCKCPLVGMPWCECFDANTIYSKIPFVFKIKAHSALEKYFWILICYFSKSHLLFLT